MKVVLDTNVLISSLLKNPSSSSQILDLITTGLLELLIDERILSEYREVLKRPKFGFDPSSIDDMIAFLDRIGHFVITQPIPSSIPDPDDLPFLEVALSGQAEVLITGNKKDFGKPPEGLKILSPTEFLKTFKSDS